MKEEQDLNEAEEKHQDHKAHDVTTGETSGSCSKTENGCSQSNSQITEVKKPFSCSECGNTFTHKRSLKYHMFMHTGKSLSPAHSVERHSIARNTLRIT